MAKSDITLKLETKTRKLPSTAFREGNPHRFPPGVSGNPSGKRARSDDHLISSALHIQLANRAPNAVAKSVELTPGSSWAQCVAAALLHEAVIGNVTAAREVREAVGDTDNRLGWRGTDGDCSRVVVEFVSSGKDTETDSERPIIEAVTEA